MKTNKNNKEEKEIVHKSFFQDENYLYEQVYDFQKTFFIRYNKTTEEIDDIEEIITDAGITIQTIQGEEIEKGVILLPKNIEEYETEEKLDKEIETYIKKWLDVDDTYRKFVVWNIRFSWLYDKFNTLNYIRAIGDTGTGKSRFLNVLGNICYKPMRVAGALTPAVIFRIIDKWKGTLLIDEGDQESSDETNAFIKIMNCGYEKGMAVLRMDMEQKDKINFYDVYCPKVITTRKRFDDKATEARCMTKIMTQTTRKDIPDILTIEYYKESESLRNKLLLYRLKNYNKIDPEIGLTIDLSEFEPRLRQVNRGFIGLFSTNEKEIERFKMYLREYQKEIIQERNDSFEGGIVQSMAELMNLGHENISPGDIAEYCNEHYKGKYDINVKHVSKFMRGLGMNIKLRKINGLVRRYICFDDLALTTIFERYLVDVELKQNVLNLLKNSNLVTQVTQVTDKSTILQGGLEGGQVTQTSSSLCNVTSVTTLLDDVDDMFIELQKEEIIDD